MVETESILNSRPLANVAEQPDNEKALTPNHFLIQRPLKSLPPGQFGDQQPASLRTWKNLMNRSWWTTYCDAWWKFICQPSADGQNGQAATTDRSKWTTSFGCWKTKHQEESGHWEDSWKQRRDGDTIVVKVKTAYGTYVRPVSGLARVFSLYFFLFSLLRF